MENNKQSLIDLVMQPLVFSSRKHQLYLEYGFDTPEDHAEAQINQMGSLELLQAISDALETQDENS